MLVDCINLSQLPGDGCRNFRLNDLAGFVPRVPHILQGLSALVQDIEGLGQVFLQEVFTELSSRQRSRRFSDLPVCIQLSLVGEDGVIEGAVFVDLKK